MHIIVSYINTEFDVDCLQIYLEDRYEFTLGRVLVGGKGHAQQTRVFCVTILQRSARDQKGDVVFGEELLLVPSPSCHLCSEVLHLFFKLYQRKLALYLCKNSHLYSVSTLPFWSSHTNSLGIRK